MLRGILNWGKSIIGGGNSIEQGGTDLGTGLRPYKPPAETLPLTWRQQRDQITAMNAEAKKLMRPKIVYTPARGPQDKT